MIIVDTKESIKLLDYKNSIEFFIDTTFRIIPKKFKSFIMMKISAKNKNKDSIISSFIFYKYQDTIASKEFLLF